MEEEVKQLNNPVNVMVSSSTQEKVCVEYVFHLFILNKHIQVTHISGIQCDVSVITYTLLQSYVTTLLSS